MARGYTVDEKAKAIAIVQAHGGITQGALDQIWETLGKSPSRSTLHDWLQKAEFGTDSENTESNRIVKKNPTQKDIEAARDDVREMFMEIVKEYTSRAVEKDVLDGLKGTQAVIGAATALDKIIKLDGMENIPTELLKALPDFIAAATIRNMNPTQIIIDLTQRLNMMGVDNGSSLH